MLAGVSCSFLRRQEQAARPCRKACFETSTGKSRNTGARHPRKKRRRKKETHTKPKQAVWWGVSNPGRPCTTLAQRPRLGQSLSRLKYYKQDRPTLQVSRALSFNQGERRWPPSSPYCLESLQPHLLPQPTLRQECLAEPASANQCVQNKVTEGTNRVYRLALKQQLVASSRQRRLRLGRTRCCMNCPVVGRFSLGRNVLDLAPRVRFLS